MDILKWLKKKNLCGLDLGSSWIKIVSLRSEKKGPTLQKMGRFVLKPTDREQPDNLGQKLKQFWSSLELGKQGIVAAMPGYEVIVKKIDFQVPDPKKIAEEVNNQAKQYIPFDINEVYLDYQILEQSADQEKQAVLLVASKKKVVQELQHIFERAELGLSIVDVDGFALTNCFEINYPELADECNFLLDIGFGHSTFCVYEPGLAPFTRDVSFGVKQVNQALSKALNKRPTEIEKIKMGGPTELSPEEKHSLGSELEKIYGAWAEEILRLINFYLTTVSQESKSSKRLFLSGGGAFLSGIQKNLSQHLSLEVPLLDPFKEIHCPQEQFDQDYLQYVAPHFAIAVGLALRTLQ